MSAMAKTFFMTSPLLALPIFALGIFLLVFALVVVRVVRSERTSFAHLERLPLDEETKEARHG